MPAHLRRQMSLIAIACVRRDMRETSASKGNLVQRAAKTLNGCISFGRKPGAVAKMTLQRAGHDADIRSQRGNAGVAMRSRCVVLERRRVLRRA